ncbi:GlsB/YeaQ/YmgE family stress response membrane protein [Chloroflexi bacterium TSY]|nr:GlsB/YeaQ/YmgE family stress response membrane protein [Chloroflexi bacterium TSY]
MGFISWIIFGALAGWIASRITGRAERMGCLTNMVVGIIGAFVGGFIGTAIFGGHGVSGFNLNSLVIAVLGALILLFVTGWFQQQQV